MTLLKKLTITTAMASLAFVGATSAQAMDDMKDGTMTGTDSTMMTGTMNGGTMMNDNMTTPTMMPTLVSGTVQRYYIDRAGYVSAMDVQTADGVRMVRFMPSMAQRVTTLYPVGSTANVYVTSRMMGKMTSYDMAGTGPDMPTPSEMMMPSDIDAIDILKAQPYVMLGAKSKTYIGNLTGYIADPLSGEVLAIVLDKDTLVRVPRENRLVKASVSPAGITPLFKGASVVVKGYDEAPLYGIVTPFSKRVAATGISVNGQTLGPLGFGKIQAKRKPLLGFNLNFFGGSAPEDLSSDSSQMGYMSYDMPANSTMMNSDGTMMNNGMMGTTADNGMMNSSSTMGTTPMQ